MASHLSQTGVDFDQAKAHLDRAFNEALFMHYHWPTLADRLTPLAQFCAGVAYLADILPPEMIREAKANLVPPDASAIEKGVEADEAYRRMAQTYDQPGNPLIAVEQPHMLELIASLEGKTVADVCCVTGRYSRYALSKNASVVHGVDFSPAMLGVAAEYARREPRLVFAQAAVDSIPLASGRYDMAICALALEHVPSVVNPIAEMARLLKPGGTLILSDYHPTLMMLGTRSGTRNYVHRVQDYFAAMTASGLCVTDLREPVVGELPAEFRVRMAHFVRTYAHIPFVLILKATRN